MSSIASTPSIYQIRHIESGKVYIGSAIHPLRRWRQHMRNLRLGVHHSPYLQHAWNRYGAEAFTFEIVEPVLFIEDLLIREQYWLNQLRASDPQYGFNAYPTAGSPLGVKHTDETRAAIAERTRAYFSDPEARAKQAEITRTQFTNPDRRAKQSDRIKQLWAAPEYRARMMAERAERYARQRKPAQPRLTRSESSKAQWADPDLRAKMTAGLKAAWDSSERRAKQSERSKAYNSDPENRAAASERTSRQFMDPAARAKISAGQRARWARERKKKGEES